MNSKNIKVVDEHNIDRSANVMFAFDLDGSEYVSYSIERDMENSNIFVSKTIKNLDGTFSMLDIDDSAEKSKLSDIVKSLITNSVESQTDKLAGNSVTLSDGKVVKFVGVSFNKEQRINVQKTYITTVKKEVVRVAEKYYAIEVVVEQPKVMEVFPNVFPVIEPSVEPVKESVSEVVAPVVESQPVEVVTPVVSTPTVEVPKVDSTDNFVSFGVEPVTTEVKVEPQVVSAVPPVVEPVKEVVSEVSVSPVPTPTPSVVEPITVSTPTPVVAPVESQPVMEPTVVVPSPVPASVPSEPVNEPLIFNAAKETNLNAALGEVANSAAIPVENIEPIREFGVDQPVVNQQPVVAPVGQPEVSAVSDGGNAISTQKAGFANSKFFMVVAIAFFLASCIFLGYEVFNYFQLTK